MILELGLRKGCLSPRLEPFTLLPVPLCPLAFATLMFEAVGVGLQSRCRGSEPVERLEEPPLGTFELRGEVAHGVSPVL